MKNNIWIIIVVIILLIGGFWYFSKKEGSLPTSTSVPTTETASETASVAGCYVAHIDKDVYTLNVTAQNGTNVSGKLSFNNFQKDSSSGTFEGIYEDEIFLVDYSFTSEGTNSVTQIILKKSGNNFVRGFGELDSTGTKFSNLNNITFDPKQTFVLTTNCPV